MNPFNIAAALSAIEPASMINSTGRFNTLARAAVLASPPSKSPITPSTTETPAPVDFSENAGQALLLVTSVAQEYNLSFLYRPTNRQRTEMAVEFSDFPDAFVGEIPHHEYLQLLQNSKFSVAIQGAGWDTLRYWEIPAMGSVLCRIPSPIVIPNDFEDGVNCIEFNSPSELREKIGHYLNTPLVYNELRANSLEHFKKFHTTKARAEYMLKECGLC